MPHGGKKRQFLALLGNLFKQLLSLIADSARQARRPFPVTQQSENVNEDYKTTSRRFLSSPYLEST
jgi:hypothetical protein